MDEAFGYTVSHLIWGLKERGISWISSFGLRVLFLVYRVLCVIGRGYFLVIILNFRCNYSYLIVSAPQKSASAIITCLYHDRVNPCHQCNWFTWGLQKGVTSRPQARWNRDTWWKFFAAHHAEKSALKDSESFCCHPPLLILAADLQKTTVAW